MIQENFNQIKAQFEALESEHSKAMSGNASAARRARKATNELGKLLKVYRKLSNEDSAKKD